MQVEAEAHPHLKGQPIAVIQYNPFGDLSTVDETENRVQNESNGSIIALGYGAAREAGVKRIMRGQEARKLCPSLQLVQVPTSNGKADLAIYRRHGQRVLDVLARKYKGIGVACLRFGSSPASIFWSAWLWACCRGMPEVHEHLDIRPVD
jgi:DNA polymerase eta